MVNPLWHSLKASLLTVASDLSCIPAVLVAGCQVVTLETACFGQGTELMLQQTQLHLLPAGNERTGWLQGKL